MRLENWVATGKSCFFAENPRKSSRVLKEGIWELEVTGDARKGGAHICMWWWGRERERRAGLYVSEHTSEDNVRCHSLDGIYLFCEVLCLTDLELNK